MNQAQNAPDDFAQAFEAAFARLQVVLLTATRGEREWPEQVAAAVRAGLRCAAADPVAAQVLTSDALAHGPDGIARHERLIAYLGEGLAPGRGERPEGERLPAITEHAMVSGVLMLVAQRIDRGKQNELLAIAGEAIQFVLTPYLGSEEAIRVGAKFLPRPDKS
jgi:hypothetical protein